MLGWPCAAVLSLFALGVSIHPPLYWLLHLPPAPNSTDQRARHNATEQRRAKKIADAFEVLKGLMEVWVAYLVAVLALRRPCLLLMSLPLPRLPATDHRPC